MRSRARRWSENYWGRTAFDSSTCCAPARPTLPLRSPTSMSENRLGLETSPYLLQHKDNPVHWWAWGPEAIAEAKRTDRPILLSVGYAACHWCHVMAHESFEDEATAAVMNELFVNIKVDREERPDIDAIYMGALHRLGEQGGWPLTMFLDSEARPFWGGTYFPKTSRFGRPAFVDVLKRVSSVFHDDAASVKHNAELLTHVLGQRTAPVSGGAPDDELLRDLTQRMVRAVDPVHGGIGGAPKFPQWSFFWLLWRGGIRYDHEPARRAVLTTLTNICQGGIYDHLGGGFARYSVDARWLAPHFEKMLYDNALLVDLLTEAWRETADPIYALRVRETVDWLMREMIAEGGGFAASLDADSEGEEGKFYVWSAEEIADVLGEQDARFFASWYDVTPEGNWEGHTILNRLGKLALADEATETRLKELRAKLLVRRDGRIRPGWDDKVLADWNGLMIAALARAARVFGEDHWLAAAERAFAFVQSRMSDGDRLWHSYRDGRAKAPATASDYANMIWSAIRLHEATGSDGFLATALKWIAVLDKHYWNDDGGGYATTADDTDDVIVRMVAGTDDAAPNANGIMVSNLAWLGLLTGDTDHLKRAEAIHDAFGADMARMQVNHTGLIASAVDLIAPQIAVVAGRDLEGAR
ncbi:MAG: thioredoxin domain-containing protein, partial [Kofleriaceae bacterium]|nr:thioredoxin domain-containing protein [Kofleriaceae bacterium]